MQDDVLPGRLRDWLTLPVLAHHDVVSPLPRPFASCGPFMVYRNVRGVNELFRKSAALPRSAGLCGSIPRLAARRAVRPSLTHPGAPARRHSVLSSARYLVFDEWWGPLRGQANMANLTSDEADAGRLRVYHGGVDTRKRGSRKAWGWEDRLYDRRGGVSFDEAMVLTWSRGVLWQGAGPAAHGGAKGGGGGAGGGAGFPLAYAHLVDSKRHAALGQAGLCRLPTLDQHTIAPHLQPTRAGRPHHHWGQLDGGERLKKLAPGAEAFSLTAHGLWLKPQGSRQHLWFSGAFGKVPALHALVRSAHLRANLSRLAAALAGARTPRRRVDAYLPCVLDVKLGGHTQEACALFCPNAPSVAACDVAKEFAAAQGGRVCARRPAPLLLNCSGSRGRGQPEVGDV